jgi:hypothetical protein
MAMAMGLEHYTERLANWYFQHGLSADDMISQSGGSP